MEIGHPTTNTLPTRTISTNRDPVAKRKKNSSVSSQHPSPMEIVRLCGRFGQRTDSDGRGPKSQHGGSDAAKTAGSSRRPCVVSPAARRPLSSWPSIVASGTEQMLRRLRSLKSSCGPTPTTTELAAGPSRCVEKAPDHHFDDRAVFAGGFVSSRAFTRTVSVIPNIFETFVIVSCRRSLLISENRLFRCMRSLA